MCYFEVDTIEVVIVTLGNVLLGCHGHEVNEPFPGYRHLSIVAHVGVSHNCIAEPFLCSYSRTSQHFMCPKVHYHVPLPDRPYPERDHLVHTTPSRLFELPDLISRKLSFHIVGLKMSSLPTLAFKSPNIIFILYFWNLSNTNRQFYILSRQERSEQYHTIDLLV
jgi:hypothetical protein